MSTLAGDSWSFRGALQDMGLSQGRTVLDSEASSDQGSFMGTVRHLWKPWNYEEKWNIDSKCVFNRIYFLEQF